MTGGAWLGLLAARWLCIIYRQVGLQYRVVWVRSKGAPPPGGRCAERKQASKQERKQACESTVSTALLPFRLPVLPELSCMYACLSACGWRDGRGLKLFSLCEQHHRFIPAKRKVSIARPKRHEPVRVSRGPCSIRLLLLVLPAATCSHRESSISPPLQSLLGPDSGHNRFPTCVMIHPPTTIRCCTSGHCSQRRASSPVSVFVCMLVLEWAGQG